MTVRRGGSWKFPISFGTLVGNLLHWMSDSSYSLIRKVLTGILCLHVDDLLLGGCGTAHRQTVNALRSRFRFANGRDIKEISVVAAFRRMFSLKRSLCLRVPMH